MAARRCTHLVNGKQCQNDAEIFRIAFAGTPQEYVCSQHYFLAERNN